MTERYDPSGRDGDGQIGREARAVRAWVRLARVYGGMVRVLEAQVREHGLSPVKFDVLTHAARTAGLNQQELANQLLVTKGNVSHLVDCFERAGLIERRAGNVRPRR